MKRALNHKLSITIAVLMGGLLLDNANAGASNDLIRQLTARILKCGVKQIHGFDLARLDQDLLQVEFYEVALISNNAGEIRKENRRDGGYAFAQGAVFVTGLRGIVRDVRQSFLLHEALGALGYNDDNYELSSSLFALASIENCASIKKLSKSSKLFSHFQVLEKISLESALVALEEGGSHVGGGGDLHASFIKTLLAVLALSDHGKSVDVRKLIHLRIENDSSRFSTLNPGESASKLSGLCSLETRYHYDSVAQKFVFNFEGLSSRNLVGQLNDLQCGADVITAYLRRSI